MFIIGDFFFVLCLSLFFTLLFLFCVFFITKYVLPLNFCVLFVYMSVILVRCCYMFFVFNIFEANVFIIQDKSNHLQSKSANWYVYVYCLCDLSVVETSKYPSFQRICFFDEIFGFFDLVSDFFSLINSFSYLFYKNLITLLVSKPPS